MRYRARWVVPITSPPIDDGCVEIDGDRIVAVERSKAGSTVDIDLGSVAILPAFVNAHTHLELSGLRGAVPPAPSMPAWVRSLFAARRAVDLTAPEPIERGIGELRAWGTGLVGDVGNTLASVTALEGAGLPATCFLELLGFRADGDRVVDEALHRIETRLERPSRSRGRPPGGPTVMLAPHAPYSVSPSLFRAIARWVADEAGRRTSVHLGESPEEVEFLVTGRGAWRTLLEELDVWTDEWPVPGSRPVAYVEQFGLLGPATLVVHGVQLDADEIGRLRRAGATVVLCARSNTWTGVGAPPVSALFRAGVRVAVGTDSLASAPDLGVPGELAALRHLAPGVPSSWLLACATSHGADALGRPDLGRLAPGARAAMIAVAVPDRVDDVEEYLVGGLEPARIRWID